jgi:hypothetical protein
VTGCVDPCELNCPSHQIREMQIDERTVLVRGCDQRATYVEQCERYGENNQGGECHRVLDHKPERRREAAPAPPAPGG